MKFDPEAVIDVIAARRVRRADFPLFDLHHFHYVPKLVCRLFQIIFHFPPLLAANLLRRCNGQVSRKSATDVSDRSRLEDAINLAERPGFILPERKRTPADYDVRIVIAKRQGAGIGEYGADTRR